ncbi:MAG: hypothetical protein GY772_22835 [bacterium]|nr:hypothetical protein [bacterium]
MLRSETAAVGERTTGTRLQAVPEDEPDEEGQMDVATARARAPEGRGPAQGCGVIAVRDRR